MRSHVALLRGINVGGKNKVAMKDLRDVVSSLGYADVETYIQSGNVVFSARADDESIRVDLEEAIARSTGVSCPVVVVSRTGLSEAMAADPFAHEKDDRKVHLVFRPAPCDQEDLELIDEAAARAKAKGSRDDVSVAGRVMYLWTPDGFGRSELAAQLSRQAMSAATARNRATVKKLAELLEL